MLSVEVHASPDAGSAQDSSLPELAVLLCLEPEGVPSLAGLPHCEEGYELQITDSGISVRATCAHGLFNGAVSLLQLLPSCAPMTGEIKLDCLEACSPKPPTWPTFACSAACSPNAARQGTRQL